MMRFIRKLNLALLLGHPIDAYVYRGNSESGQRVFVKQFMIFSLRTSINISFQDV